jgi:hypothetical protein
MDQGNREKAERVGFFVYCYMCARRQCVGGYEPPGNAIWLADLIHRGTREFVGILIEPDAEPPIIGDRDRRAPGLRHFPLACFSLLRQ